MKTKEKYVRFDWAMKRLLRDKANYAVLEGLLTTVLNDKIKINRLLESESNQEDKFDKFNRVDILAESSTGELFIVEVQNNTEYAYFQRMLFGTSKLVTEYINRGEGYEKIRKIYSINIVYFKLGRGNDYLYHGKTEFVGVNTGELLDLSPFYKQKFNVDSLSRLYPEYYILKVDEFNREPKTALEEWLYYLNTGNIPDGATAPGLSEARHKLELDMMSDEQKRSYYKHLDDIVILKDSIYTGREEGKFEGVEMGIEVGIGLGIEKGRSEGIEIGMEKGIKAAKIEIAKNLKSSGTDINLIIQATGLTEEEIDKI